MMSWAAPVRGRRPLLVLHLPARPRLAGARAGRLAEGVQRAPPCPPSPSTRSPPATSPTGGGCARPAPTSAGRCSRWRSSRAGPTTPRRSASRRASAPTTRASPPGSPWRRCQRVTRLAVSIGTHAGTMTVADGAARFEADAFCYGPAARVRGLPGHLRPDLRALHLGQAGDPPPQGPGPGPLGRRVLPAALPRPPAAPGRPAAGPDGDRAGDAERKAAHVVRSALEPFAAGCCTDSGPAGPCFTRERPCSADWPGSCW